MSPKGTARQHKAAHPSPTFLPNSQLTIVVVDHRGSRPRRGGRGAAGTKRGGQQSVSLGQVAVTLPAAPACTEVPRPIRPQAGAPQEQSFVTLMHL